MQLVRSRHITQQIARYDILYIDMLWYIYFLLFLQFWFFNLQYFFYLYFIRFCNRNRSNINRIDVFKTKTGSDDSVVNFNFENRGYAVSVTILLKNRTGLHSPLLSMESHTQVKSHTQVSISSVSMESFVCLISFLSSQNELL